MKFEDKEVNAFVVAKVDLDDITFTGLLFISSHSRILQRGNAFMNLLVDINPPQWSFNTMFVWLIFWVNVRKLLEFQKLFIPLPSIVGFYLAHFFTKNSLLLYFIFFVLKSLIGMWFVLHNFWDLNIWLANMSLKSFCKLIVADVVIATSV